MKKETATKRIYKAINNCGVEMNDTQKEKLFKVIYHDYIDFCNYDYEENTPTENLQYAIDIWLNEGKQTILDIINED